MHGGHIRAANRAALSFLRPHVDRDWSVPVPGLDFTVASVVAHVANTVLWYALDLTIGTVDDAAHEVTVRPDAAPASLLTSYATAGTVCAAVVDAVPPHTRGFHPFGSPDPSGFVAMACDEILVHCHDAATGLGEAFDADDDLAWAVLTRLFPWHDPGDEPWKTLLWANGRLDLPGAARQRDWRWHCAPLSEWDGTVPVPARVEGGTGTSS